ncbi:hypothetical protein HHI36_012877 [Cryptolaemus montrouzieri]|uniref:Uncharacterized protein n=1 Tax=Cryptolaemus montrouzieri TaxID=559131 RepID=A0ABD2NFH2_9CUCU
MQERAAVGREVVSFEGESCMFWDGIIYGRQTPLIHVPQIMRSNNYAENILGPTVFYYETKLNTNSHLCTTTPPSQNNNGRRSAPRGKRTKDAVAAYLPDMNPIEHVLDMVARAFTNGEKPPVRIEDLMNAERNGITFSFAPSITSL